MLFGDAPLAQAGRTARGLARSTGSDWPARDNLLDSGLCTALHSDSVAIAPRCCWWPWSINPGPARAAAGIRVCGAACFARTPVEPRRVMSELLDRKRHADMTLRLSRAVRTQQLRRIIFTNVEARPSWSSEIGHGIGVTFETCPRIGRGRRRLPMMIRAHGLTRSARRGSDSKKLPRQRASAHYFRSIGSSALSQPKSGVGILPAMHQRLERRREARTTVR